MPSRVDVWPLAGPLMGTRSSVSLPPNFRPCRTSSLPPTDGRADSTTVLCAGIESTPEQPPRRIALFFNSTSTFDQSTCTITELHVVHGAPVPTTNTDVTITWLSQHGDHIIEGLSSGYVILYRLAPSPSLGADHEETFVRPGPVRWVSWQRGQYGGRATSERLTVCHDDPAATPGQQPVARCYNYDRSNEGGWLQSECVFEGTKSRAVPTTLVVHDRTARTPSTLNPTDSAGWHSTVPCVVADNQNQGSMQVWPCASENDDRLEAQFQSGHGIEAGALAVHSDPSHRLDFSCNGFRQVKGDSVWDYTSCRLLVLTTACVLEVRHVCAPERLAGQVESRYRQTDDAETLMDESLQDCIRVLGSRQDDAQQPVKAWLDILGALGLERLIHAFVTQTVDSQALNAAYGWSMTALQQHGQTPAPDSMLPRVLEWRRRMLDVAYFVFVALKSRDHTAHSAVDDYRDACMQWGQHLELCAWTAAQKLDRFPRPDWGSLAAERDRWREDSQRVMQREGIAASALCVCRVVDPSQDERRQYLGVVELGQAAWYTQLDVVGMLELPCKLEDYLEASARGGVAALTVEMVGRTAARGEQKIVLLGEAVVSRSGEVNVDMVFDTQGHDHTWVLPTWAEVAQEETRKRLIVVSHVRLVVTTKGAGSAEGADEQAGSGEVRRAEPASVAVIDQLLASALSLTSASPGAAPKYHPDGIEDLLKKLQPELGKTVPHVRKTCIVYYLLWDLLGSDVAAAEGATSDRVEVLESFVDTFALPQQYATLMQALWYTDTRSHEQALNALNAKTDVHDMAIPLLRSFCSSLGPAAASPASSTSANGWPSAATTASGMTISSTTSDFSSKVDRLLSAVLPALLQTDDPTSRPSPQEHLDEADLRLLIHACARTGRLSTARDVAAAGPPERYGFLIRTVWRAVQDDFLKMDVIMGLGGVAAEAEAGQLVEFLDRLPAATEEGTKRRQALVLLLVQALRLTEARQVLRDMRQSGRASQADSLEEVVGIAEKASADEVVAALERAQKIKADNMANIAKVVARERLGAVGAEAGGMGADVAESRGGMMSAALTPYRSVRSRLPVKADDDSLMSAGSLRPRPILEGTPMRPSAALGVGAGATPTPLRRLQF